MMLMFLMIKKHFTVFVYGFLFRWSMNKFNKKKKKNRKSEVKVFNLFMNITIIWLIDWLEKRNETKWKILCGFFGFILGSLLFGGIFFYSGKFCYSEKKKTLFNLVVVVWLSIASFLCHFPFHSNFFSTKIQFN